jgi:hypothetical protein
VVSNDFCTAYKSDMVHSFEFVNYVFIPPPRTTKQKTYLSLGSRYIRCGSR